MLELTRSLARGELEACFDKDYTGKPLVINEVSASNNIYVNEYFKQKDWVEIYNPSPKAIDISGYFLSDDLDEPCKYKIEGPHTTIPAGGYKVIWCDEMPTEKYLHANFKLSNTDGELVVLSAPDMAWQDTLFYCAHSGRETVGRFPDGGKRQYRFSHPTIENGNAMNSYSVPVEEAIIADDLRLTPAFVKDRGDVYDLSGRKVNSQLSTLNPQLKKGVYIVGGKRILVR